MEGLLLELGLEFRYGDGKVLDTQPHLTRELASCHCILRLNLIKGSFNIVKGVHESSWAGLRGFFYPTHHGWLFRQLQIQNICLPTHMGRVEPMGWTNFFFYYYYFLIELKKIYHTCHLN